MIALSIFAVVLLAAVTIRALFHSMPGRLAVRSALRHQGDALLVVLGCMVGTAIITSSLLIGDTLDASIRATAPAQLGPIDVVVSTYAVPVAEVAESNLTSDLPPDADGVIGAVTAEATLATPQRAGERKVIPAARLFELDFTEARTFGGDPSMTGINGPTPELGEVVLGQDAADELGVGLGDPIEVFAYGSFGLCGWTGSCLAMGSPATPEGSILNR